MAKEAEKTNWLSILSSADDKQSHDYIHITPEIVAIFSLKDCEEQTRRSFDDRLRLAQALKSAHLAVQASLTAALAGSMNIGAHPDDLLAKKLKFFQERVGERPIGERVLSFKYLLDRALSTPMEWTGQPLELDDSEQELLARLSTLRDGIEHPKQIHWSIEIAYILEVLPLAARTAVTLLEVVVHHLEPDEFADLQACSKNIEMHCRKLENAL